MPDSPSQNKRFAAFSDGEIAALLDVFMAALENGTSCVLSAELCDEADRRVLAFEHRRYIPVLRGEMEAALTTTGGAVDPQRIVDRIAQIAEAVDQHEVSRTGLTITRVAYVIAEEFARPATNRGAV